MIEEDLLCGILVHLDIHVPRLNGVGGILVHQLHAMQGLGLVVMIMHLHHQNKGLTQDQCPLVTDQTVERGLSHDRRAVEDRTPDLHV